MTRENEGLISHEMHANYWNLDTLKKEEVLIPLELIATLRMRSWNKNQVKVDVHMENKEIWRRFNISTRFVNHFNQDSAAEIMYVNKLMKEVDLGITLIRDQGRMEVRQTFQQNSSPKLITMCDKQ